MQSRDRVVLCSEETEGVSDVCFRYLYSHKTRREQVDHTPVKMWISLPAATFVYALIMSNGVNGSKLRGANSKDDRALLDAQDYIVQIMAGDGGCIQAKGEAGDSHVILAEWEACTSFRIDENGLIRSFREGGDLCLQAGHGEPPGKIILDPVDSELQDGSKMRFYPCDSSNELQQFSWEDEIGHLKLKSRPELCAVYRGVIAHIGEDPIIFKTCNKIEKNRLDWFGD